MTLLALPDADGFIAAANTLRERLGTDLLFRVATTAEWPEGTKLNPDTGEPYDATIQQSNPEFTTVVKKGLLILKQASPLRPQPDTQFAPSGEMSGMDIIIDLAYSDFADVKDAVEVEAVERNYRIVETKPFQIAGKPYRMLLYGEEK